MFDFQELNKDFLVLRNSQMIRNLFADSKERNSVHGSDSDENASIEINFFFGND